MVFRSRTNGHCAKRKVKIYEKAKVHEKSFRIISFFSTSLLYASHSDRWFGINKKE